MSREFVLELPVVQVTLLEDRAYVLRQGSALLPAGSSLVRLSEVAPALSDRTATARVVSGQARVMDVQVIRSRRTQPEASREALNEVEARRRELKAGQAGIENQRTLLRLERQSAHRLVGHLLEEIATDASGGLSEPAKWSERLDSLQEWEQRLVVNLADLDGAYEESSRLLQEVELDLERRRGLHPRLGADLLISLEAQAAGPVELSLEYCVPGACWRPYHTATINAEEDALDFRCDACVWQNTGEDWKDVTLKFSTRRPSRGSSPPPLSTDVLQLRKKSKDLVVVSRDQEVREVGEVGLQQVSAELPGIDDGGEILLISAPSPSSIPSDGCPTRVLLFSFKTATCLQRILMGEMSCHIFTQSRQKNSSKVPILAGPVDLIRHSGLVGRSQICFVASEESFVLNWGPDPILRAQRKQEQSKEEKSDLLGSWKHTEYTVRLFLGNLGTDTREVLVTERIPVSELEQVEITQDLKATSDGAGADENGFVKWVVVLGPRGRAQKSLTYSINRRKDVVGV